LVASSAAGGEIAVEVEREGGLLVVVHPCEAF
jgi:hypothetical protein